MQQPHFSIIIPHRNVPELLERCLNSVPKRDDLEIIIIDDNSDPSVVDFEHFPGKQRPDTKINFLKENRGGGAARNKGIDIARGTWLLFADADDFFNPCISDVLNDYKDCDADLIFFNANSVDTETLKAMNRAEHLNKFMAQLDKEPDRALDNLRYLFGEPWSKMVKRSLVEEHHIRFEETMIHNDTAFAYLIGFFAEKVLADSKTLYCITARKGSVSVTVDEDKIKTRIGVFARANKFYEDHQIPLQWESLYRQLADLLITNKKLYREGMKITEGAGLSLKETKRKIWSALPKSLGRKYIKRSIPHT